ncbi:MAG: hypothetical protein QXV17_01540 [Candidatus Micrarchaeaceae archaeon]
MDYNIDLSKYSFDIYKTQHGNTVLTSKILHSLELNKLLYFYGNKFNKLNLKDVSEMLGLSKMAINFFTDYYANLRNYIIYNINDVYLLTQINE